jgi:hypothetical protein
VDQLTEREKAHRRKREASVYRAAKVGPRGKPSKVRQSRAKASASEYAERRGILVLMHNAPVCTVVSEGGTV